jgi:hypothetical protein
VTGDRGRRMVGSVVSRSTNFHHQIEAWQPITSDEVCRLVRRLFRVVPGLLYVLPRNREPDRKEGSGSCPMKQE